mmetsp:Transcript_77481/g.179602  ORF Transcript_77481/g.179602 Transcript_77481/m.179602 type:complete len:345 (-) Transcript_77481:272-1306(-)
MRLRAARFTSCTDTTDRSLSALVSSLAGAAQLTRRHNSEVTGISLALASSYRASTTAAPPQNSSSPKRQVNACVDLSPLDKVISVLRENCDIPCFKADHIHPIWMVDRLHLSWNVPFRHLGKHFGALLKASNWPDKPIQVFWNLDGSIAAHGAVSSARGLVLSSQDGGLLVPTLLHGHDMIPSLESRLPLLHELVVVHRSKDHAAGFPQADHIGHHRFVALLLPDLDDHSRQPPPLAAVGLDLLPDLEPQRGAEHPANQKDQGRSSCLNDVQDEPGVAADRLPLALRHHAVHHTQNPVPRTHPHAWILLGRIVLGGVAVRQDGGDEQARLLVRPLLFHGGLMLK